MLPSLKDTVSYKIKDINCSRENDYNDTTVLDFTSCLFSLDDEGYVACLVKDKDMLKEEVEYCAEYISLYAYISSKQFTSLCKDCHKSLTFVGTKTTLANMVKGKDKYFKDIVFSSLMNVPYNCNDDLPHDKFPRTWINLVYKYYGLELNSFLSNIDRIRQITKKLNHIIKMNGFFSREFTFQTECFKKMHSLKNNKVYRCLIDKAFLKD